MGLDKKDFCQIVEGTSVSKLRGGETLFSQFQPATDFFFCRKR